MAEYDFNPEKNQLLKQTRGIGFEAIIALIDSGCLVKTVPHPNQRKYPKQSMYFVAVDGYVYVVPFVRDGQRIFLKTIYASRRATQDYRTEGTKP